MRRGKETKEVKLRMKHAPSGLEPATQWSSAWHYLWLLHHPLSTVILIIERHYLNGRRAMCFLHKMSKHVRGGSRNSNTPRFSWFRFSAPGDFTLNHCKTVPKLRIQNAYKMGDPDRWTSLDQLLHLYIVTNKNIFVLWSRQWDLPRKMPSFTTVKSHKPVEVRALDGRRFITWELHYVELITECPPQSRGVSVVLGVVAIMGKKNRLCVCTNIKSATLLSDTTAWVLSGELMVSPIHYIYITELWLVVCLTGLVLFYYLIRQFDSVICRLII